MSRNNNQQLEIGQVIYCISNETGALYPAQVTEEVVHKSIAGTKKSYTVRLDIFDTEGQSETTFVSLDRLADQWFPALEMAREFLMTQFMNHVNELVDRAERLSAISFGGMPVESSLSPEPEPKVDEVENEQPPIKTKKKKNPKVTLPDGTVLDLAVDDVSP